MEHYIFSDAYYSNFCKLPVLVERTSKKSMEDISFVALFSINRFFFFFDTNEIC